MVSNGFTPRRSPDRARHRPSGIPSDTGSPESLEGTKKAPTEKKCRACGVTKPLDSFYREAKGKHGRKGKCRRCYDAVVGKTRTIGDGPRTPAARDWHVDHETGCWNWNGNLSFGYGYTSDPERPGKNMRAHRWTYEHFVGPIPEGMQLDHLCRNRSCVNPEHLEPVTGEVNVQRGDAAKLTPEDVRGIRRDREYLGMTLHALAAKYGIGHAQVWNIVKRKSWRNVA